MKARSWSWPLGLTWRTGEVNDRHACPWTRNLLLTTTFPRGSASAQRGFPTSTTVIVVPSSCLSHATSTRTISHGAADTRGRRPAVQRQADCTRVHARHVDHHRRPSCEFPRRICVFPGYCTPSSCIREGGVGIRVTGSPRRDFGRMGNARRMRGAHALLSYRDAPLRAAVLQCYFFLA